MAITREKWTEGYRHCVVTSGKIEKKDENGAREVVWKIEHTGKRFNVYVVCPQCFKINDVTRYHGTFLRSNYNGLEGGTCLVCRECHDHTFFIFKDWEDPKGIAACGEDNEYPRCPKEECKGYILERRWANLGLWHCRCCCQEWMKSKKGVLTRVTKGGKYVRR